MTMRRLPKSSTNATQTTASLHTMLKQGHVSPPHGVKRSSLKMAAPQKLEMESPPPPVAYSLFGFFTMARDYAAQIPGMAEVINMLAQWSG